jgi:predicted phage tail protein
MQQLVVPLEVVPCELTEGLEKMGRRLYASLMAAEQKIVELMAQLEAAEQKIAELEAREERKKQKKDKKKLKKKKIKSARKQKAKSSASRCLEDNPVPGDADEEEDSDGSS